MVSYQTNKSTIDHFFMLKRVIEKYYKFNKPLYLISIDFKQAYNSIQRIEIWNGLQLIGIHSKLILMMKVSTEGSKCMIKFCH